MVDVFTKTVTIYNDIPADDINPRRFFRNTIDKCLIYNSFAESSDSTVQKIVNSQNVITKDTERYLSPIDFFDLPDTDKEYYYTAQVDDFIVYGEVYDVVTTAREFQELQDKYRNNGFLVTAVNASVFGLDVDNVHIMHA